MKDKRDDRKNDQQMNRPAGKVKDEEAADPEHEQNDSDHE